MWKILTLCSLQWNGTNPYLPGMGDPGWGQGKVEPCSPLWESRDFPDSMAIVWRRHRCHPTMWHGDKVATDEPSR